MSRASRDKGARGEREAAALWRAYGIRAERTAQRRGDSGMPDVVVAVEPALHVEVKRQERLNVYNAIAQAVADAAPGAMPIVMHKRNRGEWLVTIRFDDFIALGRTSWNERKGLGS